MNAWHRSPESLRFLIKTKWPQADADSLDKMPGDADDVKVQNQMGDMSLEVGVDYFFDVIADQDVFEGAYYLRADASTFITKPCQNVIFREN